MDEILAKSKLTRIPISQKFVPQEAQDVKKYVEDSILNHKNNFELHSMQSNNEEKDDTKAQDEYTKEDFESVSQMLAIILSVAIMMIVFAIIVVQGILCVICVLSKQSIILL